MLRGILKLDQGIWIMIQGAWLLDLGRPTGDG